MNKFRIRKTSSDYIGAINKQNFVNINVERTGKQIIHTTNETSTLNLHTLFFEEKNACRKYRVMLTFNPYCSNVLFNTCTEIIKNEGSDNVATVTKEETTKCDGAIGKSNNLSLIDMIRNTEYSSEKYGFDYHPGLDIFNNHIIRNKSYRIVNRTNVKHSHVFNTIRDFFRLDDGSVLNKCCRLDINDIDKKDKHLYNAEDILQFENGDAINENLKEDNGWFGFYNTSTIEAKDEHGDSLDISRVINNKGNCEFIDMYPDRTLFSFAPKYNAHRGRCEYNWDVCLTYPAESVVTDENGDSITVVQDGNYNGLYVVDAKYVLSASGHKIVQFRTLTKHNLQPNDMVRILFNENENGNWETIEKLFRVYGVGTTNGKYLEYYFSITDTDLLDAIFCTPKSGETYTSWDYVRDYFYTPLTNIDKSSIRTYDNTTTEYGYHELVWYNGKLYVCVDNTTDITSASFSIQNNFIPLDDFATDYGSVGLLQMPTGMDCYIIVNGVYYILFNHDTQESYLDVCGTIDCEQFLMEIVNNAFRNDDDDDFSPTTDAPGYTSTASTLWSDYITFRVVKMDGDIPCQYYVRKFKKLPFELNEEFYQLAYATTIYGDNLGQITYTNDIDITGIVDNKGRDLTDIYATVIKSNRGYEEWYLGGDKNSSDVEYSHCFGPVTCGFDYFTTPDDNLEIRTKRKDCYDVRCIYNDGLLGINMNLADHNITINDDWFYGDVVEFNPAKYTETVLCDVNFRFNTAQREYGAVNDNFEFKYDEFVRDDYEGIFEVAERSKTYPTMHEGYYYKPHNRIRLRSEGNVKQDIHKSLNVSQSAPYQNNGMFIKLMTRYRHGLCQGDKIILIQNSTGYDWILDVVYVLGPYAFAVNKIDRTDKHYVDWVTICKGINDGSFKVKAYNDKIPDYNQKVKTGTYMWRDTIPLWEEDTDLDLVYANDALYIDQSINLYLKRQNSDRSLTEYVKNISDILQDREGEGEDQNDNNDYIEENENQC